MTLLVVTEVELARGRTLVFASDSTLGCGYRWKRGPKLFTLGASCVMAFEGSTEIAYPLLINARNFIAFSDNLSRNDAEPGAIFKRVRMDVSDAYSQLVKEELFTPNDTSCTLVLAGWSWRLGEPIIEQLIPPAPGAPPETPWSSMNIVEGQGWRAHKAFFAGNGDHDPVTTSTNALAAGTFAGARIPAFSAFLERVRDHGETAVGGVPQVALVSARNREVLGIHDNAKRRYLFGHYVPSGATGVVDYYEEDLSDSGFAVSTSHRDAIFSGIARRGGGNA